VTFGCVVFLQCFCGVKIYSDVSILKNIKRRIYIVAPFALSMDTISGMPRRSANSKIVLPSFSLFSLFF